MASTTQLTRSIRKLIDQYAQQHMGRPFDPKRPCVRLHEPTYGAEEIWEALESLLSTRITMGPKVRRFEQAFAQQFRFRHAVMVNSGSSANLLAIAALSNPAIPERFNPGDEVIVPALSWSTTVWPLIQHQLVPVVVDIEPRTMNIDPREIERALSPRTRGIMPVHVYGNPCDMSAIMRIAKRRNLIVVEDCCEAIGATYKGKAVGSFGRAGTFSFYFSHHITTLEGGMCVTNEPSLLALMKVLRNHGWALERTVSEPQANGAMIHPGFRFVNIGYNIRATEVQGGFGTVQLRKLEAFINIRTDNARYWRAALEPHADLFEFQEPTPHGTHSWFGFPMTVKESAPFSVQELTRFLNAREIETRPIIAGNIALQPAMKYYQHRVAGSLRHANHVMKNGFTFGNHQAINEAARQYVIHTIEAFLRSKGLTRAGSKRESAVACVS